MERRSAPTKMTLDFAAQTAGKDGLERSTRMTRKRIIKLLMGRGCDRNSAEALAEFFWIMRITYKSAWTAIAWEGERNGWDY